jgi:integrase/recombinase XerD
VVLLRAQSRPAGIYPHLSPFMSEAIASAGANRSSAISSDCRMHVFFDGDGRPFVLDSEMRWLTEPNAFLARVSIISGKTSSARTWRSYAYQFGDWLSFCERIGLEWRHATELNIATYRNILAAEASPLTGRVLKQGTTNHKLSVICQFYRFAQKKGWIATLPFDLECTRMSCKQWGVTGTNMYPGTGARNSLRFRESGDELEIPPRRDVRRFVKSFQRWRDRLIAEIMWLTGMRCAEVCSLRIDSLPENPTGIVNETMAVKITGKGQKRRAVLFPVRLLCAIDRYIHMERQPRARITAEESLTVFIGRGGTPLQTSAVNRVFSTNCKRTGLKIWPHLLRHCYTVERLMYLQDIGAPNPLKTVQMELGHAHMATTERYLHLTERMRSDVIEAHNSFVDRLLEG